LIYYR